MNPTVTIGILAFNEEANIGILLDEILRQKISSAHMSEILVVSDASSDGTDDIVRSFSADSVKLIRHEKRSGANQVQNTMMEYATSDILVMLDADILPENENFIEGLIRPMIGDAKVGLTSAALLPAKPENFFEKILAWNHHWKWNLFLSIGDGNNLYTCVGPARAFSHRLYKSFRFNDTVPYDAASYMFCMKEKLRFVSVRYPRAIFRCPANLRDHAKQSSRFASGKDSLIGSFGSEAKKAYSLPRISLFLYAAKECVRHPIFSMSFFGIWALVRSHKTQSFTSAWEMALSSKKIQKHNTKPTVIFSSYDNIKNPVYGGGGAIAIHEVAKRITHRFNVVILTGNYRGAIDEVVDGVVYHHIGMAFVEEHLAQLLFHFAVIWHVLTESYDIWIESFTPPFSTSCTQLFTRKPSIGLVHMLSAKDMFRKYHLPFYLIENLGIKSYRNFIVLTKESREEIRKHNTSAHIELIGNGVDVPVHPSNPDKGEHILFIGRIDIDQKGIDLLLSAYTKMRATHDVPLVIAGSGSPRSMVRLKKLISLHKLEKSVRLVGRIEGAQKEALIQNAIIGIVPSRYETFSLTALEIMSYGIPIIGFDIPGTRWIPRDAAVIVPAFDVKMMAKSMNELIENAQLRRSVSKNGREEAKRHTWDAAAERYEKYIDSLAGSAI